MRTNLATAALPRPSPSSEGNDFMWRAIAVVPDDRDVEVAVIDKDGEHPLLVPCRRTADGWIDALSRRRLDIRPTHWRPWAPRPSVSARR